MTHFIDVRQILHHLDEAQYRADDADGWRIAPAAVENFRSFFGPGFMQINFKFHHRLEFFQVGTVDGEAESLLEKGIGDVLGVLIQRDDALLAGLGREDQYFVDDPCRAYGALEENLFQVAEGRQECARRRIDQHGAARSAEHDQGGRVLRNVLNAAFLKQQAPDDAAHGQQDAQESRWIWAH